MNMQIFTFGRQVRCELISKVGFITPSLNAGGWEVPRVGEGFVFIGHLAIVDVIGVCVDEHTDDSERSGVYTLNTTKEETRERKINQSPSAMRLRAQSVQLHKKKSFHMETSVASSLPVTFSSTCCRKHQGHPNFL